MAASSTPFLLVTANVGSIFEDPTVMLKMWTKEFCATVDRLDPKFIALHCQEVGGKNYEQSMQHVDYFVRILLTCETLRLYDKARIYLDEDYTSAEKFTALGNFYFIHRTVTECLEWDFLEKKFLPVVGREINSGSIETTPTKEKSKFPQDFFPECKWSRKGFMRTRWSINGTVFDLINIHLFHDASNFVAMESFPSAYSKNRRRALEYTLDRFHNDEYGPVPFFLFGDFNFRADTQGVVKKLAEGLNAVPTPSTKSSQEYTKMQYMDSSSQVILSLGKKEFSHRDHQTLFIKNNGMSIKEFDRELEPFAGQLFEFEIRFPPSYPFEEDETGARCYMKTRCPSWCDRVVLSPTARSLIDMDDGKKFIEYGLMGRNSCMGDHKPVYLMLRLLADAGRLACCSHENPCASRLLLLATNTSTNSSGSDCPAPTLPNCTTCTSCTPHQCDELENHESGSMHAHPSPSMPQPSPQPPKQFHRAQSASAVERPPYALSRAKCRCLSDSSWQQYSFTHRLIANAPTRQLSRFNSHHSSSDEEWFEIVKPGFTNSQQKEENEATSKNVAEDKPANDSEITLNYQNALLSETNKSSASPLSITKYSLEKSSSDSTLNVDNLIIPGKNNHKLVRENALDISETDLIQNPVMKDKSLICTDLSLPKDILSSLEVSQKSNKSCNDYWSCSGETDFASCTSQCVEVPADTNLAVTITSPTKDLTDVLLPSSSKCNNNTQPPVSARKKYLCCTFL